MACSETAARSLSCPRAPSEIGLSDCWCARTSGTPFKRRKKRSSPCLCPKSRFIRAPVFTADMFSNGIPRQRALQGRLLVFEERLSHPVSRRPSRVPPASTLRCAQHIPICGNIRNACVSRGVLLRFLRILWIRQPRLQAHCSAPPMCTTRNRSSFSRRSPKRETHRHVDLLPFQSNGKSA